MLHLCAVIHVTSEVILRIVIYVSNIAMCIIELFNFFSFGVRNISGENACVTICYTNCMKGF